MFFLLQARQTIETMFFLLLQMQKVRPMAPNKMVWVRLVQAICCTMQCAASGKRTTLHRHCHLELATSKNSEIQKMICCGLWTLDCGYVRGSSVQLNCPALRNSWSHVPLITVASAGPLRNPGAARLQSIISARGPSTAASQVQFEWLSIERPNDAPASIPTGGACAKLLPP